MLGPLLYRSFISHFNPPNPLMSVSPSPLRTGEETVTGLQLSPGLFQNSCTRFHLTVCRRLRILRRSEVYVATSPGLHPPYLDDLG